MSTKVIKKAGSVREIPARFTTSVCGKGRTDGELPTVSCSVA
ncbi:hypothetical protein [uncultured Bacteroides sp.]|nr:hypothetical protein [uncultured Bacteroides sp.]